MNVLRDAAPGGLSGDCLLVMLPGAAAGAQDLVEQGFVRAVRQRGLAADIAVADTRFDQYLEAEVVAALDRDAVPARGNRPARLWMMGISLGGMGALAYARAHPGAVEGIVLLAPFLGTRGLIAEVTRAGGLARWQAGAAVGTDPERGFLAWLQGYRAGDPAFPAVHVGYGTEDRYAPASVMLAALLPARHVVSLPGGHDWTTWLALWARLLDGGVLSGDPVARTGVPT
jgi:pimeloyl-ACP methyl ester carboxylesterase